MVVTSVDWKVIVVSLLVWVIASVLEPLKVLTMVRTPRPETVEVRSKVIVVLRKESVSQCQDKMQFYRNENHLHSQEWDHCK